MAKERSNKARALIVVLVLVIIFGGCIAAVGFYAKATITEGTVDLPKEPAPSKTEVPDQNSFNAYLADVLLADTCDSKAVKTNLSSNVSIDEGSITVEGGKASLEVVKYIVSSLAGRIGESYPSHEGDFADNFNLFPTVAMPADRISSFEFRQGEVNPDDDGTAKEPDYYYFTVETGEFDIVDDAAVSQHTFPVYSAADLKPALAKVTDSLSEMFDVTVCEIKAVGSKAEVKTNRLNDQIQYLNLLTNYNVQLELSFKGDYAALETAKLSFNMSVEEKYSYTWAGAEFDDDAVYLKVGEEEMLPVTATISDKASSEDYRLSFASSDESIVTVDKDGNVKGVKTSEKPATVTMTLEYLGKTYTDTCEVYVTIPVEKAVTGPEEVTLSVSGYTSLVCTVLPEDATIKTVQWFSEDEKIATVEVDENGLVTVRGKSAGTVKVYAVTDDGHFRSSCVVNVVGGDPSGN